MERLSRDEDDPAVIIQKVKEKLASLAEH